MRGGLFRRVARLERACPAPCPACGWGGPGALYEVVVPVAGRVTDRVEPPGNRPCGLCGRPTRVSVRFPEARAGA